MTPNGKFQPEINVPSIIALQFAQGKAVNSQFRDPQGNPKREFCFSLTNGQKWYAPEHVAQDMQRHGVAANQPLQVVKRENGTIEVTPLAQAPIVPTPPQYAPAPVVQQLYRAPEPPPLPPAPQWEHSAPSSSAAPVATTERFMAAYKMAIDILLESQAYAKRQGLLLDIKCEDARALAATIMIDAQKRGGN